MYIGNKPAKNNVITLKNNYSNCIDLKFIKTLETSINQSNPHFPIIIKGNSNFFCSGLDLKFSHYLSKNELKDFIEKFEGILFKILELKTVTCAIVKGHCIGGGLILAMACDKICFYPTNKKIGLNKKYLNINLPPLPEAIIKTKLSLKNINDISDKNLLNLKNLKLDKTPHNYYLDRRININNQLIALKNNPDFFKKKEEELKSIYMKYSENKILKLNNFIHSWFKPKSKIQRELFIKIFNKNEN